MLQNKNGLHFGSLDTDLFLRIKWIDLLDTFFSEFIDLLFVFNVPEAELVLILLLELCHSCVQVQHDFILQDSLTQDEKCTCGLQQDRKPKNLSLILDVIF